MKTRREEILSHIQKLHSELNIIMNFLGDEKVMKVVESMKNSKNLTNYLTAAFDVSIITIRVMKSNQIFLKQLYLH